MTDVERSKRFLGKKVTDVISGFEGVAVGYSIWFTGCDTVGVQAPVRDGKVETLWFDVTRIEIVGDGPGLTKDGVSPKVRRTGGPQLTPADGRSIPGMGRG